MPLSATVLYGWLARAAAEKLVEHVGNGTKLEPFRFRLPPRDDDFGNVGRFGPLR